MPSSRLSLGMGGRIQDIVAIFPQGEPTDSSRLHFLEHLNKNDRKVFSVSSTTSTTGKDVKHVGVEEAAGDGFDYVLAIVDRKTGKPIEIRPTALVNFQPRFRPSEELLGGRKRKQAVDFSQDFSTTPENFRAERRRLTENFGSVKKNKMLEANIRRSVGNETLKAMNFTALPSSNLLAVKKESGSAAEEGLMEKKASSVLPEANADAKVPADVYKLEQFLPSNYDEFRNEYEAEAMEYFRREEDTFQKLVQSGTSPLVARRVGHPLRFANPGRRCLLALEMLALSKFVQTTFKSTQQSLSAKEFEAMGIPARMLAFIRDEFIGEFKKAGAGLKVQVETHEKHRALARLLCLMLLFDEPEYLLPVSPIVQELGPCEKTLKNIFIGLGCAVTVATEAQALTMNTVRVARLLGPPKKGLRIGASRKRRN